MGTHYFKHSYSWLHIRTPQAAFTVRWIFMPIVIISGLWMWKGQVVKKWFGKKDTASSHIRYMKTLI